MNAIHAAREVLLGAINQRVFPAAVVDVGSSEGPRWQEALGTLTFAEESAPTSPATPFDLASLTKVIATTTILMDLDASGAVRFDDIVAECLPEWRGTERESVTVRDLLEHAAGLPARLLERPPSSAREFEHEICTMPLEYEPRTQSVYSDLGFILLGLLAERRTGRSLASQFSTMSSRWLDIEPDLERLSFDLPGAARKMAAPTRPLADDSRRGRLLIGEVHDSYAAVLTGDAGHAGLFGTAGAVAAFARLVLRAARGARDQPEPLSAARVATVTAKSAVLGSSRAIGWDTMLPTSSCGTRMSSAAIGHVGFTGTSLWIDPPADRYFVLLTNRACDSGSPDQMRAVRRTFHDALDIF